MSDAMTDMRNNKKLRDEIEALRQKLETVVIDAEIRCEDKLDVLRQQLADSQKREVMLRDAISWCRKVTVDLDIHDALDHALSHH